jgi:hypothetical protein
MNPHDKDVSFGKFLRNVEKSSHNSDLGIHKQALFKTP